MTLAIFIISCIFVLLLTLSAALALFIFKPEDEDRFGADEIKHTMLMSFLMGLFTFLSTIAVLPTMGLIAVPVLLATVGLGAKIFYGMDLLSGFFSP